MAAFLLLGERTDHAIANNINGKSVSELSRAIGVSYPTLVSMRAKHRETTRDWSVLRRLALETGWSFDWIKNGQGKQPRKLDDEEAATLRAELATTATVSVRPAQTSALPAPASLDANLLVDALYQVTMLCQEIGIKPLIATAALRVVVDVYNAKGGRLPVSDAVMGDYLKERFAQ